MSQAKQKHLASGPKSCKSIWIIKENILKNNKPFFNKKLLFFYNLAKNINSSLPITHARETWCWLG